MGEGERGKAEGVDGGEGIIMTKRLMGLVGMKGDREELRKPRSGINHRQVDLRR